MKRLQLHTFKIEAAKTSFSDKRIAESALAEVREYIGKEYPGELPETANVYAQGKGAQDAHEAIRPTYVTRAPAELKKHLTSEEFRLYSIIWERFVSSQTNPSRASTTSVDFSAGDCLFRASSTRVVEKGFQKALALLASKEQTKALPVFVAGGKRGAGEVPPGAAFHHGPPPLHGRHHRQDPGGEGYRETLHVRADHLGAPGPLLRGQEITAAIPTILGKIINDMLSKSFPELLDPSFTAAMELRLDAVEEGTSDWQTMIREFYGPFQRKWPPSRRPWSPSRA